MPGKKDNKTSPISALFGERALVEAHGKKFIVANLKPAGQSGGVCK